MRTRLRMGKGSVYRVRYLFVNAVFKLAGGVVSSAPANVQDIGQETLSQSMPPENVQCYLVTLLCQPRALVPLAPDISEPFKPAETVRDSAKADSKPPCQHLCPRRS